MAASPTPSSPLSASNSQSSSTHPPNNVARSSTDTPPPPLTQEGDETIDGVKEETLEENPLPDDFFLNFESKETLEKFQKYEADYTQRLLSKYFSDKNIYGGEMFELKVPVDDEILRASRWPCTQSYSDPLQSYEEYLEFLSPDEEMTGSISKTEVEKSR